MNYFSTHDTFFFVGRDPRIHVPLLLETLKKEATRLISVDWSAFDTSVEYWEIVDAFDLLQAMLTFPNIHSRAAFEYSKIFFINRKIAAPDGNVYFKQRSVPSGSFFTMLIDSIINWRRILYLHYRLTKTFPKNIKVQGDDSLIATDKSVTPEGLALEIPSNSHWVINPYKCPVGDSGSTVPFLQRYLKWGDQARDVRKVERLAIYPEYPVTNGQTSAYRARALWEDCNYESPILGHATLYLESKYGLPTSIPKEHRPFWTTLFETKERADDR